MPDVTPAIAVLPYAMKLGFRPSAIPLDDLNWPLGRPKRLATGTLSDLGPQDHLLVYPSKTTHVRPSFGTRAQISMLVMEPSAIHGHHMRTLRKSHKRFFRVFASNADLLAAIPNGVFLAHGTTWVPEWRDLTINKTKMTSLIASGKTTTEGHRLRHEMVEWVRGTDQDVDVMGRGYTPFEAKSDGLAPYRYSVIIENVREQSYFTEKLIDAILCETVPIYWGCPNIADFIDTSPMILCDGADDIKAAIAAASETDYQARLPGLRVLKEQADSFTEHEIRLAKALLREIAQT